MCGHMRMQSQAIHWQACIMLCVWDMADDRLNCYFSFWAIFCPFTANRPKTQSFKKMKNMPGDIIILNMCNKNYDQMMPGSWDMVGDRWMDRQNCDFSFWDIFCPFTP